MNQCSQPKAAAVQSTDRWLIPIAIVAAISHGTWAFISPDPTYLARLATASAPASGIGSNQSSLPVDGYSTRPAPTELYYETRSPDEREYIDLAISLAEKGELRLPSGDIAKRPPLYPAFLSLIYQTQPREYWYSAAILVQSALAWLNTMLIALLAARVLDVRAGMIAGVISALYAPFLYLETLFLTETLVNFCVLSATYAYLASLRNDINHGGTPAESPHPVTRALAIGAASAFIGLAALGRPNAIVLLLAFVIHAVWSRRRGTVSVVRDAILLTVPALLILAPWVYRNHTRLGRLTLSTTGGINLYLGHNSDYAANPGLAHADYGRFDRLRAERGFSEIAADDELRRQAWSFIRDNPGEVVTNLFRKVRVWFTPTIPGFGPLLPLAMAALFAVCARRGRPEVAVHPPGNFGRLRWISLVALIVAAIAYGGHILTSSRCLPFFSPSHVLLIGIPALALLRSGLTARSLFLLIVASQLFVAVFFIPLSRIRWTVDAFFIIAIAVAASRICGIFSAARTAESRATP
ncbi:MAG: hypothetical protein KF841_12760 [Phycisphaerae bacterium]|nr:hypothetical protein [Phycisphaerae bacterium]